MVDTTERFFPTRAATDAAASANASRENGWTFSTEPLSSGAMEAYSRFADSTPTGPAQRPEWVRAWARNVNPDCILVVVRQASEMAFAMPLEVVREGPFRVARAPGGSHANGSFFAASAGFREASAKGEALQSAFRALASARPDIDLVSLERLTPDLHGTDNPLVAFPRSESPNVALAANLEDGFTALLDRMSGKRKRKKHRSQIRKFEAAGGYRCFQAGTPEVVERMLSALIAMKEVRFRKLGVANVFAPQGVQAFFRDLFTGALEDGTPRFVLSGLEVGGKLRSVAGYSRAGDRIICDFASFAEDELYTASPGDFLFYNDIELAGASGIKVFDFSVGDETYKRAWCEIETRQFDVLVPLTAKGRAAAAIGRAKARAKNFVKNNPLAWRLAQSIRAKGPARAATVENDGAAED